MTSNPFLVVAPFEVPPSAPEELAALSGGLTDAGLEAAELVVHRADGATEQGPSTLDALVRASARDEVVAVELRGASPPWSLRIPLSRGFLVGRFPAEAIDPLSPRALGLWANLFELGLAEWAMGGPADLLAPAVQGLRMPAPTEPSAPPEIGWVTYLSPDLAPRAELAELLATGRVTVLRTPAGGALMALREAGDEVAMATAFGVLKPAMPPLPRAPIMQIARGPGERPLLLRDASLGLAAYLRALAEEAAAHARSLGAESIDFTPGGLLALERCLAPEAASLPAEMREAVSAFAGEVAIARGGTWRRIMDPSFSFPANLLVQLPNDVPFHPHPILEAAIEEGRTGALAAELAEASGHGA